MDRSNSTRLVGGKGMSDKTFCLKHYRQTFPDKGCDICDLENKLANAKWNYDQLAGGREHFMGILRKSLGHPELSDEEKENI